MPPGAIFPWTVRRRRCWIGAGGPPNWGKIAEATLKSRIMCGSTEALDIQLHSLKAMIEHLPPASVVGSSFNPQARVLISLVWLYQFSPTPALRDLIVAYGNGFKSAAKSGADNTVYLIDRAADPATSPTPYYSKLPFIEGASARALTLWGLLDNDPTYITLAERIGRGVMIDPRFWVPETAPKAMVGADRAQFDGHTHCFASGMMGMIYAADAAGDVQLMQFVRSAYEYARNFGLSRVGVFGEGCTTGDMTQVAIRLSESGVGDYWDDVDSYVRNQLTEIQLMDPALLAQSVSTMNGTFSSHYATTDRDTRDVINRIIGTCVDDSSHLTKDSASVGGLDHLRAGQCHRGRLSGLGSDCALHGRRGADQPAAQPRLALAGYRLIPPL